jgi:hypothetical protein
MPGRELVSSAARQPAKAKPIPAKVRLAIRYMTYGHGEEGTPLNVVDAARAVGMEAWALRKHFDRPDTLAYLRRERRAVTAIECAANPRALGKIRDRAANAVAQVNAIKTLEEMDAPDSYRQSGASFDPHLTIRIVNVGAPAAPSPTTVIDVQPVPEPPDPYRPQVEYDREGHRLPVFDPFRDR